MGHRIHKQYTTACSKVPIVIPVPYRGNHHNLKKIAVRTIYRGLWDNHPLHLAAAPVMQLYCNEPTPLKKPYNYLQLVTFTIGERHPQLSPLDRCPLPFAPFVRTLATGVGTIAPPPMPTG
jgi:hypothetical protein